MIFKGLDANEPVMKVYAGDTPLTVTVRGKSPSSSISVGML
jgi:hypothetical protein